MEETYALSPGKTGTEQNNSVYNNQSNECAHRQVWKGAGTCVYPTVYGPLRPRLYPRVPHTYTHGGWGRKATKA